MSYGASQTICSVWFDGEYEAEVSELAGLLTRDGYSAKALTDQIGMAWTVGDKRLIRRPVVREEQRKPDAGAGFRRWAEKKRMAEKPVYRQRLGAALLVQGN